MTSIVDLACQCQTKTETIADLKRRLDQMQHLAYELVPSEGFFQESRVSRVLPSIYYLFPAEMQVSIFDLHLLMLKNFLKFTGAVYNVKRPLSPTSPPPPPDDAEEEQNLSSQLTRRATLMSARVVLRKLTILLVDELFPSAE